MQEIWKDIPNFNGLYQVSNTGKVKSFIKSNKHPGNSHLLKPNINNSGYETVSLYISRGNKKGYLVHKLVAEAFIDNPNNFPCVNHKDENKLNNNADNLEWCTYAYNNAYGTARIRSIATKSKTVSQFTLDGYWIATYLSIGIASKITGICKSSIKDCCNNKLNHAGGYIWKYQDNTQAYATDSSPESQLSK